MNTTTDEMIKFVFNLFFVILSFFILVYLYIQYDRYEQADINPTDKAIVLVCEYIYLYGLNINFYFSNLYIQSYKRKHSVSSYTKQNPNQLDYLSSFYHNQRHYNFSF